MQEFPITLPHSSFIPANNFRSEHRSVDAPKPLSTDFDEECEAYVSNLIQSFPIRVQPCEYGMGLFAKHHIAKHSVVLVEDPSFAVSRSIVEKLASSVLDPATTLRKLGSSSYTVAAMVDEALASTQYPRKISEYLPIRCLGSIEKDSATVDLAFSMIGEAYQLPSSVWTIEECNLLHKKVATNSYCTLSPA